MKALMTRRLFSLYSIKYYRKEVYEKYGLIKKW
jgi:hypothetical protein